MRTPDARSRTLLRLFRYSPNYGTSTAPTVQPSDLRATPRWSVIGQLLPAPIAGLPIMGSMVRVGPPFVLSGASMASSNVVPLAVQG